jgi:phosphopantothenoylcysteine decarboxylase
MKVLVGVTGSVAAIRTPEIYQALREAGHEVKIVATQAALYFFDPAAIGQGERGVSTRGLDQSPGRHTPIVISRRNRDIVILDEDEWPGRDAGQRYERDDPVLHIELRRWADLLLIAPLDANTLAKLAAGLADNCLTCVWRAWDPNRPVSLAPAMNTLMWEHPLTAQHLRRVAAAQFLGPAVQEGEVREGEAGTLAYPAEPRTPGKSARQEPRPPEPIDLEQLMDWINQHCSKLRIVPPVSKRLACGDVGVGAMASVPEIVNAVNETARRFEEPRTQ